MLRDRGKRWLWQEVYFHFSFPSCICLQVNWKSLSSCCNPSKMETTFFFTKSNSRAILYLKNPGKLFPKSCRSTEKHNKPTKATAMTNQPQKLLITFFFSMLSSWLFITVKPLLGLPWQPRMSFGMLTQLNVVVILVVACNLNAVVHKVIVWQLDSLLSSVKEKTNSNQWHWLGCISM